MSRGLSLSTSPWCFIQRTIAGNRIKKNEEDEPSMLKPRGEMFEQIETQITKLSSTLQTLQTEVQMLKNDFMASNDSIVNREACFRDAIDQRFKALERGMNRSLTRLETEMVNCLKRHDEHWKKEMSRVKTTSTPLSPRPFSHSFSDPVYFFSLRFLLRRHPNLLST